MLFRSNTKRFNSVQLLFGASVILCCVFLWLTCFMKFCLCWFNDRFYFSIRRQIYGYFFFLFLSSCLSSSCVVVVGTFISCRCTLNFIYFNMCMSQVHKYGGSTNTNRNSIQHTSTHTHTQPYQSFRWIAMVSCCAYAFVVSECMSMGAECEVQSAEEYLCGNLLSMIWESRIYRCHSCYVCVHHTSATPTKTKEFNKRHLSL